MKTTRIIYYFFVALLLHTQPSCGVTRSGNVHPGPLEVAVDRCIAFFQAQGEHVAPDAYLVYQYLKDRYGLPRIGSKAAFMHTLRQDTVMFASFRPFLSFMEPTPFDPEFLVSGEGSDPIMVAGLWYDKLHDKDRLNASIHAMDWTEGYMITHALLARAVARQQFAAPPADDLDPLLFQCTVDLMEANRPLWGDLEIEALAFLQFADPNFQVGKAHIDEIIALQNDDGSWSNQGADRGTADHHTTVLALWAMLEMDASRYRDNGRPLVIR